MASMSFDKNYFVSFGDHAKHLSIACNDLFEQQQFSDVTLAADDYHFDAHRLVLAAFSPYFKQMLTKVPANQHAIVFLKDVPKQTLYDLMKYIYCGEVNINREHLEEFFNAAKSLQVKGLVDDQNPQLTECQLTNLSFPDTEIVPKPETIHEFQYQSTSSSIRAQTPSNHNRTNFSIAPAHRFSDQQRDANDENFLETNLDTHVSDEMYEENQFDSFNQNDGPSVPMNNGYEPNIKRNVVDTGAPKRKRVKQNDGLLDYNILADIRSMSNGRKSLFHNNYKFYAQRIATKTRWLCTKHANKKRCNAIMSTKDIDGKTMMKIICAEHTHQAQE